MQSYTTYNSINVYYLDEVKKEYRFVTNINGNLHPDILSDKLMSFELFSVDKEKNLIGMNILGMNKGIYAFEIELDS